MRQIQKADPAKSLPFVVYHLSPEGLVWFYGRIPWFVRVLLLPMLARKNDAVRCGAAIHAGQEHAVD